MPSKNSPSKRAKSRRKSRPLTLGIVIVKRPKGMSIEKAIDAMREVTEGGGGYALPDGLEARIRWSNDNGKTFKEGDFTTEMYESAVSSRGWDSAVIGYLKLKRG